MIMRHLDNLAAAVDNEGWTAEMAIPFSVFSFNSAAIQDWTITLCRSLPRDSRYLLSWTMLDRNNPSWLGQGGLLKGLEGIKPGKSFSWSTARLESYKFNAFTMFCAGMTQDYQKYNLDDSNIYRTTGHQYFVKLQYLFTL